MGTYGNEYAKHLRGSFDLSAANTFTQRDAINVPVESEESKGIAIHDVYVELNTKDVPVAGDQIQIQVSKDSRTSMQTVGNTKTIAKFNELNQIAQDSDKKGDGNMIFHKHLDPPEFVGQDEIFISGITVGQAAATTFYFDIVYTNRKVKDATFLKNLVQNQ